MIDIHRLLTDQQYKKYLLTTPTLPSSARAMGDPWYIYVQREAHGPWARTSRPTYKKSMAVLKELLPQAHDIVVVSRRVSFGPPTRIVKMVKAGRPVMVQTPRGPIQKTRIVSWTGQGLLDMEAGDRPHTWCCYCRRPTEFRYFPKHHAFRGATVYDPSRLRCTVCGASDTLVRNGALA